MTFQYIINHLNKPHLWYIVLTAPHAELSTQKKLERQGFITYVPATSVRRTWDGRIKEIHIPAIASVYLYMQPTKKCKRCKRNMPSCLRKPLQPYIKTNKFF